MSKGAVLWSNITWHGSSRFSIYLLLRNGILTLVSTLLFLLLQIVAVLLEWLLSFYGVASNFICKKVLRALVLRILHRPRVFQMVLSARFGFIAELRPGSLELGAARVFLHVISLLVL